MNIKKPFFLLFSITLSLIILILFRSFITLIISCFFLSYIIKPLYNLIHEIIKSKSASALISEILFFTLIIGIAWFLVNSLWTQIISVSSPILASNLLNIENMTFLSFNISSIDFESPTVQETINSVVGAVQDFAGKTPLLLVNIFLLTYITYYFIKGSDTVYDTIMKIAPHSSRENMRHFFRRVDSLTKEIIYGYFLTAFIISLLTFVLLRVMGINYAVDYALFSGLASLVPVIGNWIIPLFLAVYYLINNNIVFSIILLIFAFFTGFLVKMIKPIISRNKSNIHPLLVIMGVVVGFYSLGFFGFLIGPILFGVIQTGVEELVRN